MSQVLEKINTVEQIKALADLPTNEYEYVDEHGWHLRLADGETLVITMTCETEYNSYTHENIKLFKKIKVTSVEIDDEPLDFSPSELAKALDFVEDRICAIDGVDLKAVFEEDLREAIAWEETCRDTAAWLRSQAI